MPTTMKQNQRQERHSSCLVRSVWSGLTNFSPSRLQSFRMCVYASVVRVTISLLVGMQLCEIIFCVIRNAITIDEV